MNQRLKIINNNSLRYCCYKITNSLRIASNLTYLTKIQIWNLTLAIIEKLTTIQSHVHVCVIQIDSSGKSVI